MKSYINNKIVFWQIQYKDAEENLKTNRLEIDNTALKHAMWLYYIDKLNRCDDKIKRWKYRLKLYNKISLKNKMSKKRKYHDLAEKRALTIPVVMWRFCAYKTEKDYENGNHYFMKDFLSHTKMKNFSAEHSSKEKPLYDGYCSMYWKIEINVS